MPLLNSQYALVTGATRGIGHAISMMLARTGVWVAGTATTPEGAEKISNQFLEQGLSGQGFVLDVTQQDSIKALIAQLKIINKLPHILINNAGIARDNIALRLSSKDWQVVLDTNLNGSFYLTQECLKSMLKARYGRVIFISSLIGFSGNRGQANYAASKAGLIGLAKSLALEMASTGVTINVVAPGFIKSDMTNTLSESQRAAFLKSIPMQQLGTPEDVAHACLFLATPEAHYITGHTLQVNGGLWMN
jgi:3-oxoacyl-[acyl-carrier protein] reductase